MEQLPSELNLPTTGISGMGCPCRKGLKRESKSVIFRNFIKNQKILAWVMFVGLIDKNSNIEYFLLVYLVFGYSMSL
jgi:hypothetical protein